MSFYASLPDQHHLVALWQRFPRGIQPLMSLHDAFLRNLDSALAIAERELIAAHVSALNGCHYCFAAHRRYAEAFGIDPDVFDDMYVDIGHTSLRSGISAALEYAKKLTLTPSDVDQADYEALGAAGWDEDAIHDIVMITAIYGMMNRLLEGSGMKENVALAGFDPEKAQQGKYTDLLSMIREK